MKKAILCMICVLLLCMISLPVFALEEVPGSREHDVVATYNRGDRNVYLGVADEEGRYSFTTQEGATITLTPEADVSGQYLCLSILPKESEGYLWLNGILSEKGNGLFAFYCFFADENGTPVSRSESITAAVTMPGKPEEPIIFAVANDGSYTERSANTQNEALSFTVNSDTYIGILSATQQDSGLSSGAIVGIAVGGSVFAVIVGLVIIRFVIKKK